MSDTEHAAARAPAPVPEPMPPSEPEARTAQRADASAPRPAAQPEASMALPGDPPEGSGSPARGSGDTAAPPSIDHRARQRPKLPVSDALARRLGGGRMPGKADRRGSGR